jgi:hypothetical protein
MTASTQPHRPALPGEQRTDRHHPARAQPRLELLEAPIIHPDLATPTALAATHQHRTAARVKVELCQIERLLDARPGRHRTTIRPLARSTCGPSPQQCITWTIATVRGGSGG